MARRSFLEKHYFLESDGKETRIAAFAKFFFGRERYYQRMGERLNAPAIATRLELIDRRAKEAAKLCPFDSGDVFRVFLAGAGSPGVLEERVRLVQEIVLQLRKARTAFREYSFSVKDKLAQELVGIYFTIERFSPEQLKEYSSIVRCWLGVKQRTLRLAKFELTLPNPKIPVTTCSDLKIYISTHSTRVPVSDWDDLVKNARSSHIFKY